MKRRTWVRIQRGEIVIKRESDYSHRNRTTHRGVHQATPRNIERMKAVLWRWRLQYWTAHRPDHPDYAELFAR